jgi:hypothetical protein
MLRERNVVPSLLIAAAGSLSAAACDSSPAANGWSDAGAGMVGASDSDSASSSGSSSGGSGSGSTGSGSSSGGLGSSSGTSSSSSSGSSSASSSGATSVDAGGDVTILPGADSGPAADAGSVGTDGGAPSAADIDRLLALTKSCTQANSAPSSHVYPDPGSAVPNDYICTLKGAVFFNADMDIDCDGRMSTHCPGTGADKDCCYQPMTSFTNLQGQPLSAEATPYVVIPLDFMYPGLDQTNGGNVIAVIYNHQLEFAVFGDQGPTNLIGEASYATANNLGINPSPARGGIGSGVTYIVFVGPGTQPHDIENQAETRQLGSQLTAKLLANN